VFGYYRTMSLFRYNTPNIMHTDKTHQHSDVLTCSVEEIVIVRCISCIVPKQKEIAQPTMIL